MTVFAVMRGTELYGVYKAQGLAQEVADRYNKIFKLGKRYTVFPMTVRETAEI